MKQYILAHDFGTSSDKIVLFSFDGEIVRSRVEKYATQITPDGGSEQDPEDWWKTFCHGNAFILEGIDPQDIACCAIDGTDPNLICIDEEGTALYPSIMWFDSRAREVSAAWNEEAKAKGLPPISVNSTIAKYLWMKRHHPEILEKSHLILSTNHSYLLYRLCKAAVCDSDSAIDSGMYDRSTKDWHEKILEEAGIDRKTFPRIVGPTEIVGTIAEEVSKECGLPSGIPLIGCYPDASAAAVGTGAYLLHNAILSCGTSAGIMYTAEKEDFGFKPGTFSISAGSSYNWALDILIGERDHKKAEEMLKNAPPGAHGVLFHPYLSGERSPYLNPSARGSWSGLNQAVTRDDLLRSVAEGIAMNLSILLEEIRGKGYPVEEMSITGGFSKSDTLCQIFADVMDVRIHTLKDPDLSAAMGSAVLGGVAIGIYEDISVVKKFLRSEKTFAPDKERAAYYASRKELYRKVYEQFLPVYPEY